jgi:hypothetical protein
MLKNKTMKTRSLRFNQMIYTTMFVVLFLIVNMNVDGAEASVAADLKRVAETRLVVEDWMVSEKYWDISSSASTVEKEADPVSGIESWMLDESKWDIKLFRSIVVLNDETLKVEDWMINKNLWN